jgi:D-alanyl-D-alanine carboxypeptidase
MQRGSVIKLITGVLVAGQLGLWTLQGVSSLPMLAPNLESAAPDTVLGASVGLAPTPTPTPAPVRLEEVREPFVNARHYALFDHASGTLLVNGDADALVPIASTTKLMTALVVLEVIQDLNAPIAITAENSATIGSRAKIRPGDTLTAQQLLEALMVVSGNDAAKVLAATAGQQLLQDPTADVTVAVARFVEEMNTKAREIGMVNTTYRDPAGLDDEGRSTARELAMLMSYFIAEKPEELASLNIASKTISGSLQVAYPLSNSNRLALEPQYAGLIIGKTGFTPDAGHCLVAAATRNGMTLISVILSTYADTKTASAEQTRNILDWGFSSYQPASEYADTLLGGGEIR